MKIHALITSAAVLLAACSDEPQQQAITVPTTKEGALVASAGIDVKRDEQRAASQADTTLNDAGLAVGMATEFGTAGLGLGLVNTLTSPSATLANRSTILATIPATTDPETRELAYSEAAYQVIGVDPTARGYKRVYNPKVPSALIFIREGCQKNRRGYYDRECSIRFSSNVRKKENAADGGAYIVSFSGFGNSTDFKELHDIQALSPTDDRKYEAFVRRVVDQLPSELSLYIRPRKINGEVQPARLYQNGKETILR